MTGMHPGHAWIRNNGEVKPEGQRPIPGEQVTIAEVFKNGFKITCELIHVRPRRRDKKKSLRLIF